MERLHSIILTMAGFDDDEPVGHLVVITREDGQTTETLQLDLELTRQPVIGDARQWARQVLALALAEL